MSVFSSLKSALTLAALAACALAPMQQASAQTAAWPSKPVRIIVSFPPGGTSDIVARLIGQHLTDKLGQQFIVDNRPGAGGTLAGELVHKEAPDGYTLILANNAPFTIAPTQFKKIPYDPVADFTHIGYIGASAPGLLVQPSLGVKNLGDFIALARKDPKISYGSSGVGSISHILGEGVKKKAGIAMVHVPYKGNAPALTDVIAGRVDMIFDQQVSSEAFVKSGQLKPLAVTSSRRMPGAPQVPTLAESGFPQFDIVSWYGLALRTGTPQPIVDKLHAAIGEVLAEPDVRKKLQAAGVEPGATTPQAFGQLMRDDTARWGQVIRKAGITVQ